LAHFAWAGPAFDAARASFLSLGFYPTKDMTDADGSLFKPGPFARTYLIGELLGTQRMGKQLVRGGVVHLVEGRSRSA
jgi:hypothetical protein